MGAYLLYTTQCHTASLIFWCDSIEQPGVGGISAVVVSGAGAPLQMMRRWWN